MYRKFAFGIICCLLVITAAAAYAEDVAGQGPISAKLDAGYVSQYLWRGLVLNPDPSLQPSLTLSHKSGASLNVWGSGDLTNVNGEQNRLTEIDYTLDYARKLKAGMLNGGFICYTFPNTGLDRTSEVYAAYCLDRKITTTLSANYDVDQIKGLYTSLAVGYACSAPWQKATAPKLNVSARVGFATSNYNAAYFGPNKAAFTDLLVSASVPIKVSERFDLTPSLSYSRVLDSALRDAVVDPDNWCLGLTASMPL